MDLASALTMEVETLLFPLPAPAAGSHDVFYSQTVTAAEGLEFVGITLPASVEMVVAFWGMVDLAEGDIPLMEQTVKAWSHLEDRVTLQVDAKLVKMFRRGAKDADRFEPSLHRLPKSLNIWAFQRALTQVLVSYTIDYPNVKQFFFLPQSVELDSWYRRMARTFCSASGALDSGVVFRQIAGPVEDDGGLYGYERT